MNVEQGKDKKNGKKAKEDEKSSSSSDSDLSSDAETTWIIWFCSLKGNEFFTEIDDEYIQDDFNLTGLSSMVPHYDQALEMILDGDTDDNMTDDQQDEIETASEMLYGLIHARYILTNRGLAAMVEKYNTVQFGRCPRVFCQGQPVLPVGQSDIPRMNTVKLFCPKCQDIYYPKLSRHANLDGAYFGTTFPHLLLQMYPELIPNKPINSYIPRIYGFKIHKTARQMQQYQQHQQALQVQQQQQQQSSHFQQNYQQQQQQQQQPTQQTSQLQNNTPKSPRGVKK